MKQEFYAAKNKDNSVRIRSSSGGVFYSMALNVIEDNGVVYGAIYDDNLDVVHARIDNINDLKKLHGSKYTQSKLGNSYKMVKEDLKNNIKVLFSGTPCQIQALKLFLKDDDITNLFLVDIICHGTPQPLFFDEYKRYMEKKYNSKITKINMRHKEEKVFNKNLNNSYVALSRVQPEVMGIEFANKKRYVSKTEFDVFYQLFDLFIKRTCFKCPYANLNRNSDITIGDFHEFSSKLGEFNDGNGVSLLIVNTTKGKKKLEKIKDEFELQSKTASECMQPHLEQPMTEPSNYNQFHEDYQKYGFDYVVKKYGKGGAKYKLKKQLYKIGVLDKMLKLKTWCNK